jgi:hypothetical protein
MLPDSKMMTTTCRPGKIYLGDIHVIPGNSGSPIFLWPARPNSEVKIGGEQNLFGLLGVVSGFMQENQDLTLRASTTWEASVKSNTGISAIVPAEQLKALLDSPELQRERDEVVAGIIQNRR